MPGSQDLCLEHGSAAETLTNRVRPKDRLLRHAWTTGGTLSLQPRSWSDGSDHVQDLRKFETCHFSLYADYRPSPASCPPFAVLAFIP